MSPTKPKPRRPVMKHSMERYLLIGAILFTSFAGSLSFLS